MKTFNDKIFENINMEDGVLSDYEFIDCTFMGARFINGTLDNCVFSDCRFLNCNINSVKPKETYISFCQFFDCQLIGVLWDELQAGNLSFPIQKLERCFLKYNHFNKMNFKRFDFGKSKIIESDFNACNIAEGDLSHCDLTNTRFVGCDLRRCDFRHSLGYSIELNSNKLRGAEFSYPEAMNLLRDLNIIIEK